MKFEKDGKQINVLKALWDGVKVSVTLVRDNQEQIITGSKSPHGDFKAALESLRDIFLYHMELDGYEGLPERIRVIGIEEKDTKTSKKGYRIKGFLSCPGIGSHCSLATSTLTIPGEGFFDIEDEYGDHINDPDEYLYFLSDDEVELLHSAFHEAFLYAVEGKVAAPEQPDLLDGLAEEGESEGGEGDSGEESDFDEWPDPSDMF